MNRTLLWFLPPLSLLALGVLYLLTWPVPIEPRHWSAPMPPGYSGAHAANQRLAGLQHVDLGHETGPEHVAFGRDGKLYAAVASGRILRLNADGSGREVFADTGGRVLGFDFDAAGNLIAADAVRGLLSISPKRQTTVLLDRLDGEPIRYADAVVVARDGTVYLSDASTRFAPRDWGGTFEASVLDILEQSSTGRVIAYSPRDRRAWVVATGLAFANGVALSADQHSLYVAETGRYRIWRIPASARGLRLPDGPGGSAVGGAELLFDNLPGYPDNLMRGQDGRIWVGLVKPRNPTVDTLATRPWLRAVTLRLPRSMWPVPQAYGHVFAFTPDGRVVADLQDPKGTYPETTGVLEAKDRLYVMSLHANELGWLPKPEFLKPPLAPAPSGKQAP